MQALGRQASKSLPGVKGAAPSNLPVFLSLFTGDVLALPRVNSLMDVGPEFTHDFALFSDVASFTPGKLFGGCRKSKDLFINLYHAQFVLSIEKCLVKTKKKWRWKWKLGKKEKKRIQTGRKFFSLSFWNPPRTHFSLNKECILQCANASKSLPRVIGVTPRRLLTANAWIWTLPIYPGLTLRSMPAQKAWNNSMVTVVYSIFRGNLRSFLELKRKELCLFYAVMKCFFVVSCDASKTALPPDGRCAQLFLDGLISRRPLTLLCDCSNLIYAIILFGAIIFEYLLLTIWV